MQDRGATTRTGMQIGSNESIANMQDQGATNRTGMTTKSNEGIATMQDQGATNRTGMQTKSNESIATLQDQGATNRTGMTTQSQETITDKNNKATDERQTHQGQINLMLKEEEERLRREGKVVDRDELFNFGTAHGGSEDEVRRAILDIKEHPPAQSPMSKDEIAQALDIVAVNRLGQGHTNQELVALLPPDVLAELNQEMSKHNNPAGAAAAAEAVLAKRGYFKDNSTFHGFFGKTPKFERAPEAPPPAQTPAAGAPAPGPRYAYDPKTGKTVRVQ
jgi:hypothetical protein